MRSGPPLALDPRNCDRCGHCLSACPHDALKVGRTYLKVDWSRCDACGACARACGRRAIVLRGAPAPGRRRGASAAAPAHTAPVARRASATPRSRTAGTAAKREDAGRSVLERLRDAGAPATASLKGGKRGGFQWTLLEAAAMLSVTFSAFTLKESVTLLPQVTSLPDTAATTVRVGVLALYYVVQVAVLGWLVRRRGGSPLAAVGLTPAGRGVRHALTSALLVVPTLAVTRLIASLYAYVTREAGLMPSVSTDLPTLFGADAGGFILAVVMVVVVGPVVEEAVFRAALLEGLAARLGAWPAIVLQAALFAAFHRSLWLLFPTFVLGVALGWLAHRRESLWPAIAAHGLYNAITVAAAFLVRPA